MAFESGTDYRTSYLYNPHFEYKIKGNTGSGRITAYDKLSKFPKTKCLAIDVFHDPAYASHRTGSKEVPSYNLLFPDGHVSPAQSAIAWQMMNTYGDVGQDWSKFEDIQDVLETVAAGLDPRSRPLVNRVPH